GSQASEPCASDEARLLEIVIGLDDFPQLVLGPLVTPVGIGVMALHQLLEAVLDGGAIRTLGEVQRLQRLLLQGLQSARRFGLVAAKALLEKGVRIREGATEAALFLGTMDVAGSPGAPSRPVADDGILLEGLHLRRAPALEVVVRGVKLPHMIEA